MPVKYTKEILESAIASSDSWVGVMRKLGRSPRGGGLHRHLKKRAAHYGIDYSHFTGSAHAKGKRSNRRLTADEVLVKMLPTACRQKVAVLRRALFDIGRPHECVGPDCALGPVWRGKPLVLQVDHTNGDSTDNTRENLRFLCPNCHSQTGNFGGNARRR